MSDPWKKAQDEVDRVFKAFEETRKDFVWKRFTDTYEAQGKVVQAQFSDRWVLWRGLFSLVEIKSCHQDRFPFKDVRPVQFIGARRVAAAGGNSIFLIKHVPTGLWHRICGMELWRQKESSGMSSIGWDQMERIALTIPTIFKEG